LMDVLCGGLIPATGCTLSTETPEREKDDNSRFNSCSKGCGSGEKCLYIYAFPKTKEELAAGATSHGWSLDGIELVELMADEQELDGESQVTMYHPSEGRAAGDDETSFSMRSSGSIPAASFLIRCRNCAWLAQNSLRYRRQILALKQFLHRPALHRPLCWDDGSAEGGGYAIAKYRPRCHDAGAVRSCGYGGPEPPPACASTK